MSLGRQGYAKALCRPVGGRANGSHFSDSPTKTDEFRAPTGKGLRRSLEVMDKLGVVDNNLSSDPFSCRWDIQHALEGRSSNHVHERAADRSACLGGTYEPARRGPVIMDRCVSGGVRARTPVPACHIDKAFERWHDLDSSILMGA